MPYCMNCGTKISDDSKFCKRCGAKVTFVNNKRETVYDGKVHKCPNCGELLKAFEIKCPTCGYEIRSANNSCINELNQKIHEANSFEEKQELISNFYVPNTREDIFDFFILAISNLENESNENYDAWRSKLEQTYYKAKIAFKDDSEIKYIEELYSKVKKKEAKNKFSNSIKKHNGMTIIIIGIILLLTGIIMIVCGITKDLNGIKAGGLIFFLVSIYFFGLAEKHVLEKKDIKGIRKQK